VADRVVVSFEGVGANDGPGCTVIGHYFGSLWSIIEHSFW
jgi:hypothetical protein